MSGELQPGTTCVLGVDDEQDIRDGSRRILERAGFAVRTAGRGDDALRTLDDTPVSIVLLDLKMPGMDGMDVLDRIRKTPSPPRRARSECGGTPRRSGRRAARRAP